MSPQLERMKAIVAQVIAQAHRDSIDLRLATVHLTVYGNFSSEQTRNLFAKASRNTDAEGVLIVTERAGSRYICWNCCGLRFESEDAMCSNCGETAMELPGEIDFALGRVEVATAK